VAVAPVGWLRLLSQPQGRETWAVSVGWAFGNRSFRRGKNSSRRLDGATLLGLGWNFEQV